MYFPILRGRQYELIALRELAENSILSENVVPIVEPVKLSPTLIKTMEVFRDKDKKLAIVCNPQVGNFNKDLKKEQNESLRTKFLKLIGSENFLKTFYIVQDCKTHIEKFSKKGIKVSNIVTICENVDNVHVFQKLFSTKEPMYNLIPDENGFKRRIQNNQVMIKDRFYRRDRNSDYLNNEDEFFSEDHLYYDHDGYKGFVDYSIVGKEYDENGFAPHAVAIHIVYFDEEEGLRIRHFVSDSNDDIYDPAGKFGEAVNKLRVWYENQNEKNRSTLGMKGFIQLQEEERYPNLGPIKKLSIMHHLELIGNFLDKQSM